jgi:hypothetical protein
VFVVEHRLRALEVKPHVHIAIEMVCKCKCCRALNHVCGRSMWRLVAGTVAWMACVLLLLLLFRASDQSAGVRVSRERDKPSGKLVTDADGSALSFGVVEGIPLY